MGKFQNSPLNSNDLKSIAKAVEDVEAKNMIEIVPVFIKQADFYEIALLRGGILFSIIGAIVLLLINNFTDIFLLQPLIVIFILVFLFGILGALIVQFLPFLKRLFAGKELLKEKAFDKAHHAFYENSVFGTENRIGVLIFVSHFEHQAAIIPDSYLTSIIKNEDWEIILKKMIDAIKNKEITNAFITAINDTSDLVESYKIFETSPFREIPDDVIIPKDEL